MQKLPLQKTTLPDLIVKHIEDLLARGALKPGDKLPTERELMDLFAVGVPGRPEHPGTAPGGTAGRAGVNTR